MLCGSVAQLYATWRHASADANPPPAPAVKPPVARSAGAKNEEAKKLAAALGIASLKVYSRNATQIGSIQLRSIQREFGVALLKG